jgi:hypothetical protein
MLSGKHALPCRYAVLGPWSGGGPRAFKQPTNLADEPLWGFLRLS